MRRRAKRVEVGLVGRWHDTMRDASGTVVFDSGWHSNQIQDGAYTLISLLLRQFPLHPSGSDYVGLSYLAVGSGEAGWDVTPPTTLTSATGLVTETFRKAIEITSMVFLDPDTDAISATPTTKFLIEVEFGVDEANGPLREFAVFGGDAFATANSGIIFNYVSHDVVNKESGYTLTRTVTFEVLTNEV